MRVLNIGDKIAVAANRRKVTKVSDLPDILTRVLPSNVQEEYYIDIHNLAITEICSDPYINFKAVDKKGNLWYGLLFDKDDNHIKIPNLTVALPAYLYNPSKMNLEKNAYFDVTAVLHNLKRNMKKNSTKNMCECSDLYAKIRKAFNEL